MQIDFGKQKKVENKAKVFLFFADKGLVVKNPLQGKQMKFEVTRELLKKLSHKDIVRFAVFCAEQVRYLTGLDEAREALEITKKWLDGKATIDECRTAGAAARAVYTAATGAAACDTYATGAAGAAAACAGTDTGSAWYAAYAAAYAAHAAAGAADRAADYAADTDDYAYADRSADE